MKNLPILFIVFCVLQWTACQVIKKDDQSNANAAEKSNVVYIFTDQWRASALGYSGDPNVKTPKIN